jgi:hypothetical protein
MAVTATASIIGVTCENTPKPEMSEHYFVRRSI